MVIVPLLVALPTACGQKPPAELLTGTWETRTTGETRTVEFRADGTVEPEGEELQGWELLEAEPLIVRIIDLEDGEVDAELTLVIENENEISLSGEGRTMRLRRVE